MYLYLYDSFLNDKKHHSLLAKIETRLTDLGIGGKIFRLSPLRNIAEIIKDEVRLGAKSIIVVGNDRTFNEILNVAVGQDVTLGIIPVGEGNAIAGLLGINSTQEAANIIAARTVERLDLGLANNTYFLTYITMEKGPAIIECDTSFRLSAQPGDTIRLCNILPGLPLLKEKYFNPRDRLFYILI